MFCFSTHEHQDQYLIFSKADIEPIVKTGFLMINTKKLSVELKWQKSLYLLGFNFLKFGDLTK